jgi:hypothetical protein
VATAAGLFKSWVGDLVGSDGQLLQHGVTTASNDSSQPQQQQQQASAGIEGSSGAAVAGSSSSSSSSSSTAVGRWSRADVSADLAVLLREHYNAEALYPYDLAYSGGKPLPEVECVVTVRLEA